LIDVFSHKTNLNLVLEFLDTDLENVIKDKSLVFMPADIKSWMMMALRGLDHCHKCWLLHRDLKPNNFLIASDGQLKLADFGLAREFGDVKRAMTSQTVTRWYRAPELLMGAANYTGSIDIWAMGCIFAELLLRAPYLPGDTDLDQLTTIFKARGTPTEDDWPGMSKLPTGFSFEKYPKPSLADLFHGASEDTLDLMNRMLTYNPVTRITAAEALQHPYFRNFPRPTRPAKLPRPKQESAVDGDRNSDSGKKKRQFNDAFDGDVFADASTVADRMPEATTVSANVAFCSAADKTNWTENASPVHVHSEQQQHEEHAGKIELLEHNKAGSRITLIGMGANFGMSVAKGLAGVHFHSSALLADAAHSMSDIIGDIVTLYTFRKSRQPADSGHPYGYGRYEALGTLFISAFLVASGFGIGAHALEQVVHLLPDTFSAFSASSHSVVDSAREIAGAVMNSSSDAAASAASAVSDGAANPTTAAAPSSSPLLGHSHSHSHGMHTVVNGNVVVDPRAIWFGVGSIVVNEALYQATMK
ncbi:TFIIH complex serine/threonine-protein kinase subunit kin28, partial [Coemansia erecta]